MHVEYICRTHVYNTCEIYNTYVEYTHMYNCTYNFMMFMKNSIKFISQNFLLRIPKLEQWLAFCWPHNTCIIIYIKQLKWLFNEAILSLVTLLCADIFYSVPCQCVPFHSILSYTVLVLTIKVCLAYKKKSTYHRLIQYTKKKSESR